MTEVRDEVIDRAARSLGALPPVRPGAVARVLMAVRAAGVRPAPAWKRAIWWLEDTTVSARATAMMAAASLVIGFVAQRALGREDAAPLVAGPAPAMEPAADAGALRAVPVALVFEQANATSVAVVGDFNGWDPRATPMQRIGASGPWSATVLAKPGRHTYAYLVDGTTLVVDPLAPKVTNPDFGGDASVMMVRTP